MAEDTAVPPEVTSLMRRFRSRDTKPEMEVRHRLHAAGLRYRLHTPVPEHSRRTIDIAFPKLKVAVFIDGCYWHSCPEHGKVPTKNTERWAWKLTGNVARDRETDEVLREAGWTVLRYWEHEDPSVVAALIDGVVQAKRLKP